MTLPNTDNRYFSGSLQAGIRVHFVEVKGLTKRRRTNQKAASRLRLADLCWHRKQSTPSGVLSFSPASARWNGVPGSDTAKTTLTLPPRHR